MGLCSVRRPIHTHASGQAGDFRTTWKVTGILEPIQEAISVMKATFQEVRVQPDHSVVH